MAYSSHHTKYIFIWAWLLLLGFKSYAFFGKYPIQNFTPIEYKAGIQNIDFAQNRDMTLFVANNLGVLAYNGNDWKVHAFQSGKKQRSLAFDENTNRLYVGSQGEFGYFSAEWAYESLTALIPQEARDFDEVWDVFLFESNVYFCTFQHIYVYDGESIVVIEHPDGIERSFQVNGKLFTQSHRGALLEIKGLELAPVFAQKETDQIIAGIIPQDGGYLLFYNSGQIEFSSPFASMENYDALSKALQGSFVNHVLQLSDTRLAISTQTSGLFLYDFQENSIEQITTKNGLQANACLRAFQDFSGNLWVGMQSGIALIHINSPLRLINQDINLQGSGYDAYELGAGTYYTTSNGIYFLDKNAKQTVFLPGTEGPAYGLQVIAGRLYAGHHTGLFLLDGNQAIRLANTDGLWQINQLRSNPQFAIAGTYSGLFLFKIDEGKKMLQPVGKIEDFQESSRFFEEDHRGKIIVGQYYKGLYELNLQADMTGVDVKNLSENSELPIQDQIILSEVDNELYVSTNEGQYKIDRAKGGIVEAANLSEQIGKQPVYLLKQDRFKNIHIIGENMVGFFKQISSNNYVFVPSSLFQLRYFLNNDLLNVSVNIKNGVMFSANEGFLYYNPELEDRLAVKKPVVVSKVYSVTQNKILYARQPFEEKPKRTQDIVIDQKAKVLQFDIESFHFQDVNNQQFRYVLKGFDEDYGEWTNATTKEYTNLKEGDYEFVAQTRNYLGETTTSLPFFVEVKPPFFRSPLAKALYVLLGIAALLLISRYQKQKYKKKAKKIEARKQDELEQKQQELVNVEQQKDEELSQLEAEKVESELRHLNNLLAASTMNLVVKNEFIENIKQELKEVRKKGKHDETKQALVRIEREIDTTLKLQEDWKQFEHHFDQVHGDFLTRLREGFTDLSPNDQKLCAFLRLNLNTKEIANLMNISLRGVEVARYRLRKKLGLEKGTNLSKFILEY